MNHDPGKEPIPQTVEALLAETMLEMRRENGELRRLLNVERHKNMTLWKRMAELERSLSEQSA